MTNGRCNRMPVALAVVTALAWPIPAWLAAVVIAAEPGASGPAKRPAQPPRASLASQIPLPLPAIQPMAKAQNGHGLLCRLGPKTILMVSGTPEQMGTAHGTLLREPARRLTDRVLYMVGGAESIHSGAWFIDIPARFFEECDALSAAAGISTRDGRYANLFPERFHCSGVAVRGQASVGGRVIHARVLDYMRDIHLQNAAAVQVFMPDGYHRWMSPICVDTIGHSPWHPTPSNAGAYFGLGASPGPIRRS
jgi:hypothetical protein